jgi:hypothetical protein
MSGLEHAALLAAVIILGPIYFLIWWEHKDLQRKMIRLSLFGAITGPIAAWWYLGDYLHEGIKIGIFGFFLDLLVAFLLIGVTSVTVNVLANRRSENTDRIGLRSRYVLTAVVVFGVLLTLTELFDFSSLYSSAVGLLVVAGIIWRERNDLISYSLLGGGALLAFGFVCYLALMVLAPTIASDEGINTLASSTSTLPLKELLWLFSWGLVGSVLYEWRHGYKFVQRHDSV